MLYLPSPWSKTHSPPPIFNWVFLIVTSTTFRSTFSWITSWLLDLVMIYFSYTEVILIFKERWDANPIARHRYVQRYECLMSSSKRYYCPPLTLNRRQRHPIPSCSKAWILSAVPAACLEVSPPFSFAFQIE